MTLDTIVSLLRAILSAIGGIVIARGWVDSDTFTLIIGFVVSLITAVWSWRANAFGLEQYLGVVRTGTAAIGGYLVFRGYITNGQLVQYGGIAVTIATAVWGVFFKTATPVITKTST